MTLREFLEDGLKNRYFERSDSLLVQTTDGEDITFGDVEDVLDSDGDCLDLLYSGYDRNDDGSFVATVDK